MSMKTNATLRASRFLVFLFAVFYLHLPLSGATATFQVVDDWGSGFTGSVTVTNDGAEAISEWELSFDFNKTFESVWNASRVSSNGNRHTFRNAAWNGSLSPGQSTTFGFVASPGNLGTSTPANFAFAGNSHEETESDQSGVDPDNSTDSETDDFSTDQTSGSDSDSFSDSGGDTSVDTGSDTGDTTDSSNDSTGSASVAFDVTSSWYDGYTAYVRLTNDGSDTIEGWTVQFDLSGSITDFWSATDGSRSGNTYTFSNEGWNGTLLPGDTISFGIQAGGTNTQSISNVVVNNSTTGSTDTGPGTTDSDNGTTTDTGSSSSSGTLDTDDGTTGEDPVNETNPGPITNGKRVVAYFPSWGIYQKDYYVEDIPAENLTHIIHAFATITAEGKIAIIDSWADLEIPMGPDTWENPIRGHFGAYARLKEANPSLRVLIAVGGWFDSGRFSEVAATDSARKTFATSVREFCVQYGFDGVDLDWEYPVVATGVNGNVRPEDSTNYAKLAAAIRSEFDAQERIDGKTYEISAATPAGFDKFERIDLAALSAQLDFINMMTYDFHGRWVKNKTGHNAPLFANPNDANPRYNVDGAVQGYLSAGVPSDKLVLGIPAYGYGWTGVPFAAPYGSAAGTGPGTLSVEPGFYDYRTVAALLVQNPQHNYWDEASQVSFYYDGNLWISYDGPQSLLRKIDYIEEYNLGGMMFWETATDIRDNNNPDQLMKIASDHLK